MVKIADDLFKREVKYEACYVFCSRRNNIALFAICCSEHATTDGIVKQPRLPIKAVECC